MVVLLGAQTPVVLRRAAESEAPHVAEAEDGYELVGEAQRERYQLVGKCYMHGMMDGEILDGGGEVEEFVVC